MYEIILTCLLFASGEYYRKYKETDRIAHYISTYFTLSAFVSLLLIPEIKFVFAIFQMNPLLQFIHNDTFTYSPVVTIVVEVIILNLPLITMALFSLLYLAKGKGKDKYIFSLGLLFVIVMFAQTEQFDKLKLQEGSENKLNFSIPWNDEIIIQNEAHDQNNKQRQSTDNDIKVEIQDEQIKQEQKKYNTNAQTQKSNPVRDDLSTQDAKYIKPKYQEESKEKVKEKNPDPTWWDVLKLIFEILAEFA